MFDVFCFFGPRAVRGSMQLIARHVIRTYETSSYICSMPSEWVPDSVFITSFSSRLGWSNNDAFDR